MAYIYDLTDTWSAGGTAFNAIKMNVTDSASAAGSKLITLQTNGAEHFSVSKAGVGYFSGNLGIGTNAPSYLLTTNYNANATFTNAGSDFAQMWQNSSTNALGIALADDLTARFVTNNGYSIAFNSASSEFMRITSAGNVGIGTTSPVGKLEVVNNGTALRLNTTFAGGNSVDLNPFILGVANDGYSVTVGSTIRQVITGAGNVGIGTTTPSNRFVVSNAGANGFEFNTTDNIVQTYNRATSLYTDFNLYSLNHRIFTGTSPTEKMRINSSGDVCVAATSGLYSLPGRGNITIGGTASAILALGTSASTSTYLYHDLVSSNAELWNTANGFLRFATNNSEQMRIDSAGRVGIGTSSPTIKLQVTDVDQATARIGVNNANGQNYHLVAGNPGASNNGFAIFDATASATRMYLDSSGNVGIGTTAPAGYGGKLSVFGTIACTDGPTLLSIRTSGGEANLGSYNASGSFITFKTNASGSGEQERARIDASGNLLVGTTSATAGYRSTINGALLLGSGSSLSWGVGYNSGGPTIAGATNLLAFYPNGATSGETMRIDSSGNIGIGTTAPGYTTSGRTTVYTNGSSSSLLGLGVNGTDAGYIGAFGSTAVEIAAAGASRSLVLTTNGAERARIDSSGNLLVGTTSVPTSGVQGVQIGTTGFIRTGAATTGGTGHIAFNNPNGEVGLIATSGTGTSYNTSSDYRLKDIDGPITDSGTYIDALKPVQGSWKADGSRFIGLLAHEVQEVSETPIATGEKDGEEMQAMDYSAPEIIANLIAEIQSLRARVAQLEGN